jgi:thiamine biosynthesis protein ThiS
MPATITITANGARHELSASLALDDFLKSVGLAPQLVVVERNRQPLTPSEARRTVLADGDVLEVVRIVAGG